METPSEWAKKFNQQKTDEVVETPEPEPVAVDSAASVAEFPSEPFLCPACGQLLGPSCRVCVACKHPINPAEIALTPAVAVVAAHAPSTQAKREAVRYPWRILIAVMGIGMILGLISLALLGDEKGLLVIQAIPVFVGVWVFYDAYQRRLPRPFRWGIGTMMLLAIIFPWYLARRSKPEAVVPFVEAEVGPVTRILLIALLIFFLIGLVFNIVQGPQPGSTPTSTPKIEQNTSGSPSRITRLRPPAIGNCPSQEARTSPSSTAPTT